MERKGQAAMEFLMTYGWAILAAIIAIGVLAYFGVFSPSKYVSNSCVINAPLSCEEFAVSGGNMQLAIRNGYGSTINITKINVTGCSAEYSTNTQYNDGDVKTSTFACSSTPGTFKGDITITYIKASGTISQTTTGSIKARI